MSTISPAEYLALVTKPKRPKFGNRRTSVDGKRFDSAAEARQYGELLIREKAGEISGLECQTRFPLVVNDVAIGHYVADFVYFDIVAGKRRVIDVKGVATPLFRRTAKHFQAQYGYEIEIVRAR